jgi:hypothetical protein
MKEVKLAKKEEVEKEDEDDDDDEKDSDTSDDSSGSEPSSQQAGNKITLPFRRAEDKSKGTSKAKAADDGVAGLEKSMSALQFVPTSVTLNRKGKGKK